jgi:ribonuclease HII
MSLQKPKAMSPDLVSEASLGFFVSGTLIIGVDEVGRGCLAGPVVAGAAVLLPDRVEALGFSAQGHRPESSATVHPLLQVRDSKLMSEEERERVLPALAEFVGAHAVAEASVEEIARLNILHASQLAMERAVTAVEAFLGRKADCVLVDGNRVPPGLRDRGRAIVKGDLKSLSIASASIFAKVHRDRLMDRMDEAYPGYGLSRHKGYPTPFHKERIRELGATSIHRAGFKGVG